MCAAADMEINGAFPLRTVRLLRTILVELSKERWETKTDRHIQRPGAVRRVPERVAAQVIP